MKIAYYKFGQSAVIIEAKVGIPGFINNEHDWLLNAP